MNEEIHPARRLWHCIEHLHAVIYFHPDCAAAFTSIGLGDFWAGYFANRSAPLGPVGPGVVEAQFFNFAPDMVRRWIPEVWAVAPPSLVVETRRRAAAHVLWACLTASDQTVARAVTVLSACVESAPSSGRPLFGANRDLPTTGTSVEALWQLCTTLREHRGDGHVAALTAAGLSGCEPHRLMAAETGVPAKMFTRNRGWSEADWESAGAALAAKGLLQGPGMLTTAGMELRARIEATTDDLALSAFEAVGPSRVEVLLADLGPMARDVARAGVIRYPNAMGLPPLGEAPS